MPVHPDVAARFHYLDGLPSLREAYGGSEVPFGDQSSSAAAGEARGEDDLPLYVACGGPLTKCRHGAARRA